MFGYEENLTALAQYCRRFIGANFITYFRDRRIVEALPESYQVFFREQKQQDVLIAKLLVVMSKLSYDEMLNCTSYKPISISGRLTV